jgi:hypothetical protein
MTLVVRQQLVWRVAEQGADSLGNFCADEKCPYLVRDRGIL